MNSPYKYTSSQPEQTFYLKYLNLVPELRDLIEGETGLLLLGDTDGFTLVSGSLGVLTTYSQSPGQKKISRVLALVYISRIDLSRTGCFNWSN